MLTQRTGGWPLTMFLTPDQLPFFGGTYFPEDGALRHARASASCCERVRAFYDEQRGEIARAERAAASRRSRACSRAGRRRVRRASRARRSTRRPRSSREQLRPGARRLRRRAEVPASRHDSSCCCAATPLRGDAHALDMARFTLRADGRGRHLRPARRRLLPLQRRRRLGHPALREDALRQRLAAAPVRGRLGRHAASRSSRACARRPRPG